MHIVELIDTYLAEHGDRERAADRTGAWTGRRLGERARRLAGGLQARGVRRGDRVAVMMANGVDVLVAYEAIWRAGAAITPLMPALVEDEVAHILGSAEPAAVLVSAGTADVVRAARATVGGTFPLAGDGGDVPWAELDAEPAPVVHDDGDLEDVKKVLIRLELQPADVRFCVGWWPVLWSWACGWGSGGRTLGYG